MRVGLLRGVETYRVLQISTSIGKRERQKSLYSIRLLILSQLKRFKNGRNDPCFPKNRDRSNHIIIIIIIGLIN